MSVVGVVLVAVAVLAPWQIYPGSGVTGPLSLVQILVGLLAAALLFEASLRPDRPLFATSPPLLALGSFVALCLLGTAWSPDPGLALRTSVKLAGIGIVALGTAAVPSRVRRRAIVGFAASASVVALMIVVFRLFPLYEVGYWLTFPADITIDPELLSSVRAGTRPINALSPGKAGAVFSNANGASLFLGTTLFLLLSVTGRSSRLAAAMAAVLVAGVVATGSKAGLGSLLACGFAWLAWVERKHLTLGRVQLVLLGGVITAGGLALYFQELQLGEATAVALESRTDIWGTALPMLVDHPLHGLGFGGWEQWAAEQFRFLGLSALYPPHNLFLIAWAWVGLPGAVLVGVFLGTLLFGPFRIGSDGLPGDERRAALFLAFVWFSAQSMFTNAAVTNPRVGVVLGLAIGLMSPPALGRVAGQAVSGRGPGDRP